MKVLYLKHNSRMSVKHVAIIKKSVDPAPRQPFPPLNLIVEYPCDVFEINCRRVKSYKYIENKFKIVMLKFDDGNIYVEIRRKTTIDGYEFVSYYPIKFGTYHNRKFTGFLTNEVDIEFFGNIIPTYKIIEDDKFITKCYADYAKDQCQLFLKKYKDILEKNRQFYFAKELQCCKRNKLLSGIFLVIFMMFIIYRILIKIELFFTEISLYI